jgi:hypothetical protein
MKNGVEYHSTVTANGLPIVEEIPYVLIYQLITVG